MPSPVAAHQAGRALAGGAPSPSDASDWNEVLATVPLFAELNRRHLRKVAAAARVVRFADRTRIARAGEPGDVFYVILDGGATVSARGLRAISLPAGGHFGEMSLLDDGPRSATVTAKGDVVCLAITRARFAKLLRSEPSIAIALLAELSRRLRVARAAA
jgi:CRP/FNR family transcriptional regulator, cyclic AMP receptor protein